MKRQIILLGILFGFALGLEPQSRIPDFTVKLLNGKTMTVQDLVKDGPVLIDFWATWCVPCRKEMRYLNAFHQQYTADGFKVLAIDQDTPKSLAKVRSLIRSNRYEFLVGLDPNKQISQKLNAVVLPTTLIVDRDGTIRWQHQGYIPGDEQEIERQIQSVLKEAKEARETGDPNQ
ncbi:MAG: TlpA family protein disulfide reductase [Fidelibacterota bacterium]